MLFIREINRYMKLRGDAYSRMFEQLHVSRSAAGMLQAPSCPQAQAAGSGALRLPAGEYGSGYPGGKPRGMNSRPGQRNGKQKRYMLYGVNRIRLLFDLLTGCL